MMIEKREASWTAPALWRFAGIRTIRRISDEPFCANINRNCYSASAPFPRCAKDFAFSRFLS
jgi:hypothetical protein